MMKQWKRLTSVLLVLGMVLGLMPLSAFAAEPENPAENSFTVIEPDNGYVDTYTYTLDGGTAKLTGFSTTASEAQADAVIPSEIPSTTGGGYRVTSIGDGAFANHNELKTVTLPNSIISIGDYAFTYCTQLTTVNFGNSVDSIGIGAFASCKKLKTVTLPDSIKSIGNSAFYDCSQLTTVDLGNLVESIGASAFAGCTQLTTVNLGSSVDSIGDSAFAFCTSMKELTIPSSVRTIGEKAFHDAEWTWNENGGVWNERQSLETLYYTGTQAQWDELAEKNDFENKNPMLTKAKVHCAHTVSFDCGNQATGFSKVVQYGETVARPDDPKAEGYQFEDWYTDKSGGTLFDFDQKITEDVTVYAHWSKVEATPDPDLDKEYTLTDEGYTLTDKDGSLVRVTVVENEKTVDITKSVVLKKQGTTQIGKIPAGAMVTVAANAAPEGMVFAQWNISDPALMGDPAVAYTSQTMTFPMPAADVTVEAMYESAENARVTELLGSAAIIGAVGVSAVVLAYQAHQLGTELYLKYLLPSGAALPQNRLQLAELLWKNAGEPVPDVNAVYDDIDLKDEAAQQAAQWVLENELMELPDEEHTGQFKPDEQISYGEAIRAWKKAQQLKTAE